MRKSLFIGLVAILSLFGCSRNQEVDVPDANLSLFARTESPADTKTVVESGVHVYWEPGDEIAVFMGEESAKFATDITSASGTASFKGTFGDATWPEDLDLWAVYPFSEDAVFDGETITTTLPSEQVAREGSFGKDMNLAIAHSTGTTLQFYNVGGGIRFSVTEEGIKKVMFEGLSGEIISGKVKIGMDENGKPEVKEVTGGSQFITLLPPNGSETFQKDTWYYIVAIPGSLEAGYKLRFYKDSDYARKVSEKAVQIKRSIYGSIEKADEGMEYEAQVTHFPKTEEEWSRSEEVTNQLKITIDRLVYSDDGEIIVVNDDLLKQIENVDGVLAVKENSSATGFGVMQKDSLWINYLLDAKKPLIIGNQNASSISQNSQSQFMARKNLPTDGSFYHSSEDSYYLNSKKKALILAPFQHSFNESLDEISECLIRAGFQESNIDVYPDRLALISFFLGDFLCEYDYILITTHGGTFYYMRNDDSFEEVSDVSSLMTYVPYSGPLAESFISQGLLNEEDIAVSLVDDDHDGISEGYFAMTPRFLSDVTFNSSTVFLCACHSAEISDEDNPGSMVWRFLHQGAGYVAGNNDTTSYPTDTPCIIQLLELVSRGFSLQDASNIIKNSPSTREFCDNMYYYCRTKYPEKVSEEDEFAFKYYNLFNYFTNPKLGNSPYFLVNPFSTLCEPEISRETVSFSWDSPISSFELIWEHPDPIDDSVLYSKDFYRINYDFYIDDARPYEGRNLEDLCFIWENPTIGKHTGYVVTKIWQNNFVAGEYQSNVVPFDVPGIGDIEGTEEDPWN